MKKNSKIKHCKDAGTPHNQGENSSPSGRMTPDELLVHFDARIKYWHKKTEREFHLGTLDSERLQTMLEDAVKSAAPDFDPRRPGNQTWMNDRLRFKTGDFKKDLQRIPEDRKHMKSLASCTSEDEQKSGEFVSPETVEDRDIDGTPRSQDPGEGLDRDWFYNALRRLPGNIREVCLVRMDSKSDNDSDRELGKAKSNLTRRTLDKLIDTFKPVVPDVWYEHARARIERKKTSRRNTRRKSTK